MNIDCSIKKLESILKILSEHEKNGLDTSSLKVFIKSLKTFNKIQEKRNNRLDQKIKPGKKLELIKEFLEDNKVFPSIKDIISFANDDLGLSFKDQKESRATTIQRIIKRVEKEPEIKDNIKNAVRDIRNNIVHNKNTSNKKHTGDIESYSKWAEVLSNL